MSRLRLLSRSPVNPGGINLGDRYDVLSDVETPIVNLGKKLISLMLEGCPKLDACVDYRIELVTDVGTITKRVRLSSYAPPFAVFIPEE